MPIVRSRFKPAWWLRGAHLQTLWPSFFRKRLALPLCTEILELDDGDFLELSFYGPSGGRLVMLLHGLEGSRDSHYLSGLMAVLGSVGYRVVLLHFRGCNGRPNRLPRSYHSGDTDDLDAVLAWLGSRQQRVFALIGFSLGGNVLLKWLGEQGDQAQVQCAVAVSVPFRLDDAARRLDTGWSRLYQRHLLKSLKASYREKFSRMKSPLQVDLRRIRNFRQFDDAITAPLHGFAGVDDYYRKSSSRAYIATITRPTLILHARNDPFMYPDTVPEASEIPAAVTLELSADGGHVGFVSGWQKYWIDGRILQWLRESSG